MFQFHWQREILRSLTWRTPICFEKERKYDEKEEVVGKGDHGSPTRTVVLRFCRTWTKRYYSYLIISQTRVKRASRIHHRTILSKMACTLGTSMVGCMSFDFDRQGLVVTLKCGDMRSRTVLNRRAFPKTENPQLPIEITSVSPGDLPANVSVSQTLSYLCSDTCFSSYLSLLLRTLSALSVLPSLAARICQSYLFYLHLSPAPVRPICSLGVTLVDYKRCALLIILWFWFPSWSSYLKLEILMDCCYIAAILERASLELSGRDGAEKVLKFIWGKIATGQTCWTNRKTEAEWYNLLYLSETN